MGITSAGSGRARASALAPDVIDALELELLLLGRHTAMVTSDVTTPPRLDRSAYLLLTRLELSGAMTLKELADALRLDVSTVNRQSAALLRAGLAERIPGTADSIARRYRPTAEGLALLHADRDDRREQLRELIAAWDGADTRSLVQSLRRFNEQIEARQCITWPREG